MKNFRYILRFAIDPTNAPQECILRLHEFTQESGAEEVMFLIAPEERSCGHITREEAEPWVQVIQEAKAILNSLGVEVSLNPWTTTYHAGRGRRLHPGQNFRLMIGETGKNNGISPCPLCEQWQAYLTDYFSYLAESIDPIAIWIEDDWRLHNHGTEMGYGGCFCDVCLDHFSQKVGEKVTREQALKHICAPGDVHPWRSAWTELAREALEAPAQKLTQALKQDYPHIRLGLMSSIPDVHSIEGRDWNRLMDIWTSNDDRYLIRPHMPPYTETPPITTAPTFSRHTIANLDKACDIYPELENSPRCGPYSGSHTYTKWQMMNAALYGSQGITINHFDNMGMNTYYDRGLGTKLGATKKRLDALMPLNLNDKNARGVNVLFSPKISNYMHSYRQDSLFGCIQDSIAWSSVFYPLGISHRFTKTIDDNNSSIYAVSNQTLRAFSDDEIQKLLQHPVLLDFPSIEVLLERGFGKLIGINTIKTSSLQESAYSYEEIDSTFLEETVPDMKFRTCAQRNADSIGMIDYNADTKILSRLMQADGHVVAPASGLYKNELGGQIFTTCYPLGQAQFFMAYFNCVRQDFFTQLLKNMADEGSGLTIVSGHPMHVHAINTEQGIFCGASNVIYDTSENIHITLHASEIRDKTIQVLVNDTWQKVTLETSYQQNWAQIHTQEPIPVLDTLCLLLN